jgi:hypothetical protein
MKKTLSLTLLSLALTLLLGDLVRAQEVVIEGRVLEADKAGIYLPLEGVSVQAFRNGGPILKNAIPTNKTGYFTFSVEAGLPFTVGFSMDDPNVQRVPQLTELAGAPGAHNGVVVALFRVDDYKALATQGKLLDLRVALECIKDRANKESAAAIAADKILKSLPR